MWIHFGILLQYQSAWVVVLVWQTQLRWDQLWANSAYDSEIRKYHTEFKWLSLWSVHRQKMRPNTTAEVHVTVQHDDDGTSGQSNWFVTEFVDRLIRPGKPMDQSIMEDLADILNDTFLTWRKSRGLSGIQGDCEDVFTRTTGNLIKKDGFKRAVVRNITTKNYSYATLSWKM